MLGWTLVETHSTQGRIFHRPLDAKEAALFWFGKFDGAADILHPVELHLVHPGQDAYLFSNANIIKAWLSTKRRHPFAGASIQVPPATSEPYYVVREHGLAVLRPNEIVFGEVGCAEEVEQRVSDILDGPRPLSDELLTQLYVFREKRTDVLHLMTLMAHCMTDGTAHRTFIRCLLDTLARSGQPDAEPAQIALEERLAMALSSSDLEPVHMRALSLARRRWRWGIATVIVRSRMARRQGGHTLPCRYTRATLRTPARSGFASTVLTEAQTTTAIANCRRYGITFGNAYLVLAQVAMTRVLYRRYLRGDISEEEWAYRKRQPHICDGPVNLRPYLDKDWFENGGAGECIHTICRYQYRLPFMTLGDTTRHPYEAHALPDGAPPFSDLLTMDRFVYRAGLVKKQAKAFFGHPLFHELRRVINVELCHRVQDLAQWWTQQVEMTNGVGHANGSDEVLAVTDMPPVSTHAGSTLGDVHLMLPTEYPLPPSHPLSPFSPAHHPARAGYPSPAPIDVDTTPRIVMNNTMPVSRIHSDPGELYLNALTSRGRLSMYIFYDRNMFEDEVVQEWLDEVKGAVEWYLCQTHQWRRGAHEHAMKGRNA